MALFLINFAVALGIGLVIGLERERSKAAEAAAGAGTAAGLRTFALVALVGAIAMQLGGPMLLGAMASVVAVFSIVAYLGRRRDHPGLTTEMALLATALLGGMAITSPQLAGTIAIVIAGLLAMKPALHRFARGWLTEAEVGDGLVLAVATIVIWPSLPDRTMGPYAAINPHLLWLVVILVLAIGAVGHIAVRLIGPRFGLSVSGLASGFVSSVATIGAMGSRARSEPETLIAAVAGGTLSSLATFVQMAMILAAVSMPVLRAFTPMLIAGGGVIAVYGGLFLLQAARSTAPPPAAERRAFSIVAALLFAASLAAIMMLTAAAQPLLGNTGVALGAALGGIVDTHAAAMSVAALAASGRLAPDAAIIPILAAMTANASMKIGMAFTTGGLAYAQRIAGGIILSMAAAWGAALLM